MYDDWKFYIKGRSINSLFLDELNIRTPIADQKLSQADLIKELVENDKIFELAKIIERLGYFPSEGPIIMARASKTGTFTVLEGNRRVTAVKLILDPDKAPGNWKAKFQKLHDKANLANFRKIPVWVVPSRASAEICIAMKHAPPEGGALESWTPIQQAAFYDRHKKGLSVRCA